MIAGDFDHEIFVVPHHLTFCMCFVKYTFQIVTKIVYICVFEVPDSLHPYVYARVELWLCRLHEIIITTTGMVSRSLVSFLENQHANKSHLTIYAIIIK